VQASDNKSVEKSLGGYLGTLIALRFRVGLGQ